MIFMFALPVFKVYRHFFGVYQIHGLISCNRLLVAEFAYLFHFPTKIIV